ncbi:MAG: hypothetical protein GJT30_13300 [Geobacter sp.]|nr:hypothetical protein [Geobacter sp.]
MPLGTRHIQTLLGAVLALVLLAQPAHAAQRRIEMIRLHGDPQSLAALILPLKDAFEKATGIRLVVTAQLSPAWAMSEIDQGACDGVLAAAPFEEIMRQILERKLLLRNRALIQHQQLYEDVEYRVIVNALNPVSSLTEKQLRKIFSGRYRNWDDVDGADAPLSVVWGAWSTGTAWVLADRIMAGEELTKAVVPAEGPVGVVREVAASANAIGIVPATADLRSVKILQTPELAIKGPFILVTVGFPSPNLLRLIKFMKSEGQHLIGY